MKKQMSLLFTIIFFICIAANINAQKKETRNYENLQKFKTHDIQIKKSEILPLKTLGEIKHKSSDVNWSITFKSEIKKHELFEETMKIKEEKTKLKQKDNIEPYNSQSNKSPMDLPVIGRNFPGNIFHGYLPPDNSMAISKSGYIISVINSSIFYYDMNGNVLYGDLFSNFFDGLGLYATIYDPRVIYDPVNDRFILVVLHGTSSESSKVLFAFSQSENPNDGWWVYDITGNPFSDGSWFDYPNIGISNEDLFITGNLFFDNMSFNQSIIFQISKDEGYNGGELSLIYWTGFGNDPYDAFTIVPVNYNPHGGFYNGIYLVSNNPSGSNKIRLYDITDNISGDPVCNLYALDIDQYSLGGNAYQQNTNILLNTGDNRIQNGFYMGDEIHFVFHSESFNGYNGINYNRIDLNNSNISSTMFGFDGVDFCYPFVCSFSNSADDHKVLIAYCYTSPINYPGVLVSGVDNQMNWTDAAIVAQGQNYVEVGETQGVTRWGDYACIVRKYDEQNPKAWLSGGFGNTQEIQSQL
ncbi:MAG: hypothetical protein K8R58_03570 [Bacteroidales bacterium]|nr:hypothetical protein [Bacteroidales bacterium]